MYICKLEKSLGGPWLPPVISKLRHWYHHRFEKYFLANFNPVQNNQL